MRIEISITAIWRRWRARRRAGELARLRIVEERLAARRRILEAYEKEKLTQWPL